MTIHRLQSKPIGSSGEFAPVRAHEPSAPVPDKVAGSEPTGNPEKAVARAAETHGGRTPAERDDLPSFGDGGDIDLSAPELYLSRELTWLNYNVRVLHEAEDTRVPLLERVKFLAIASSNLDEFFMKRIGGLRQQIGAGVREPHIDGRTPTEQAEACLKSVRRFEARRSDVVVALLGELEDRDIVITTFDQLSDGNRKQLRETYVQNVYPLVTPQATDPAHPFPFISNLSINLLVSCRYEGSKTTSLARVKVPIGAGTPRFLQLGESNTYVTLESVMAGNLDLLFPDMVVEACHTFRVTRNANTELHEEDDDADDLLAAIESDLRKRKFAPIVRLEIDASAPDHLAGMLAAELSLAESDEVTRVEGMFGLSDLMEIADLTVPDLHYEPHHPIDHPKVYTDRSVFHVVRETGPLLFHHPYESFVTSIERFLREASQDAKVLAIKMTLYRTSADTKVIDYLIDAARNGKQVAVVVELKARFDEAANIRWANRLESAGIHVTYGVLGLKTHCKAILVVRRDYDMLRRYAHIGTGNYHAGTARQYSDLGLLTCDEAVGADLTELFNYLTTGYKPKRSYKKVLVSPKLLKRALLQRIEREIQHHRADAPGIIQFKMNALEDPEVTSALYRASQAGVRVDLIVRDTCRLRPGIPGVSDNIHVISVVGRFLEHARIYYFGNGGDEEYYIGSADCMRRNLDSRVEAVVPVEGAEERQELRRMLDAQLSDRRNAWDMHPDGSYTQRQPDETDGIGSQDALIALAERRKKKSSRLKRRPLRGVGRRNVPPEP